MPLSSPVQLSAVVTPHRKIPLRFSHDHEHHEHHEHAVPEKRVSTRDLFLQIQVHEQQQHDSEEAHHCDVRVRGWQKLKLYGYAFYHGLQEDLKLLWQKLKQGLFFWRKPVVA